MKSIKWGRINMTFKEKKYDEEGNLCIDKKTGKPIMVFVKRVVKHNVGYIPR